MENDTRTVKSKQCPKCNRTKLISEFTKDKSKKSGVASWCKKCKCATTKKYRNSKKGKEYLEKYRRSEKAKEVSKRARNTIKKKYPRRYWARCTLNNHRHRKNKIEITVDKLEDKANQTPYCEICGCVLAWGYNNKNGKAHSNSPSLDKINNENTITEDNIQILCYKCNRLKASKTISELILWCEMVIKKFKKK